MAVKKGSKNNIANRGSAARIKTYEGKSVKPVKLINGKQRFMAAQFEDGKMVRTPDGKFVPYASIE
jgi:hypothetical protein